MTDELVHLQLASQVIVDQIGKLRPTLDATEGATFPYAARDQLEGCRCKNKFGLVSLRVRLSGKQREKKRGFSDCELIKIK